MSDLLHINANEAISRCCDEDPSACVGGSAGGMYVVYPTNRKKYIS
jgi:hypothetical protein